MQQMEITYYLHSGFSCAVDRVLLIFDYWLGENQDLAESRRIKPEDLQKFDEVYVFISHSHPDHFDPEVYTWHGLAPVTYIVSYEMPVGTRGKRMNPGDELQLSDHVHVTAFDSTDLGVSFLVDIDGIRVFHAGDLNFWHWREESTVQEIEEAQEAFHQACEPLVGQEIDVAFFPVDPRQGRLFDAGANYFILTVKPRLLVPMHFWGRAEIATEFARRSRCRETECVAMVRPGSQIRLLFGDDRFMTIQIPRSNYSMLPEATPSTVSLDAFENEDPFTDSDLPVDL